MMKLQNIFTTFVFVCSLIFLGLRQLSIITLTPLLSDCSRGLLSSTFACGAFWVVNVTPLLYITMLSLLLWAILRKKSEGSYVFTIVWFALYFAWVLLPLVALLPLPAFALYGVFGVVAAGLSLPLQRFFHTSRLSNKVKYALAIGVAIIAFPLVNYLYSIIR